LASFSHQISAAIANQLHTKKHIFFGFYQCVLINKKKEEYHIFLLLITQVLGKFFFK